MSFSFRNKFPDITMCVVFQVEGENTSSWDSKLCFGCEILLNRTRLLYLDRGRFKHVTDHIYLFDLKSPVLQLNEDLEEDVWNIQDFEKKWNDVLKKEWNEVVIKFKCVWKPRSVYCGVKCIGVYAYNYEKCKADVDWTGSKIKIEEDRCGFNLPNLLFTHKFDQFYLFNCGRL